LKEFARRFEGTGVLFWPLIFWTAAFALPLFSVAARAAGSIQGFSDLLNSPYYRGVLYFSIRQAAVSTVFSVFLGLPGAYFIGRHQFPGRKILRSVSAIPFVLPSILAVLGFILVFGNSGLLNTLTGRLSGSAGRWKILYSFEAIILAHVFYNFPLTIRIVGDAWQSLPLSRYHAARSLGAGSFRGFLTVDLPVLSPAILTSAIVTFLYCFLSFAIILVLGGGPQFTTLEVEVYRLIKFQLDFARGSSLAVVESLIAVTLMAVYAAVDSTLRKRTAEESYSARKRDLLKISRRKSIPGVLYLIPSLFLILAPLISIMVYSFLGRTTRSASLHFSLSHWESLFSAGRTGSATALQSIIRTFTLGFTVAGITTFTAALVSRYTAHREGTAVKIIESMLFLPMGISSVILGLGYLILTNRIPGGDVLRIMALTAAHTIMALPFAYRIISGRMKQISRRIPQAAGASGAGAVRSFFTIDIPISRGALVTAAVFTLALSAGELNATIILAPESFTTMTLAIYRMIGSYDIFGACALGTILILISFLSFLLLDKFGEHAS